MKFGDTLTEVVKQDLEAGIIPALMGESGIGKSSFMEDIAYAMNTRCITVQCNLLADKSDLTGARLTKHVDASGVETYRQSFYPHEDIAEAIEYAENNPTEYPILFLDEINRTTPDVTSGTLGITTARKIGRKLLPKNLRIAIAGNLQGNVTALDEASMSRFSIYEVEPDAPTLIAILGDAMNSWVKQVLTQFPDMVFERPVEAVAAIDGSDDDDDDTRSATAFMSVYDTGEKMRQITTPRTIEYLSKWLNTTDTKQLGRYLATPARVENADSSQLMELVVAKVGNTKLAAQVVATIAQDLASGPATSTSAQLTVPRPACYDQLKAVNTVTDLENLIGTLSDADKSGSLLFAMHEHGDNSLLIQHLAPSIQTFESAHNRTLMEMLRLQKFDAQNIQVFLDSGSVLAGKLEYTISNFI